MTRTLLLALALPSLVACGGAGRDLDPGPMQENCAATHDKVGLEAEFRTYQHDVAGTARIQDDCTIELMDFSFDGDGVDVRFVVDTDDGFEDYRVISQDLRENGPYENVALTVPLPEGISLDDFSALSVWCVPFGVDFGSLVFESVL